MTTLTCIFDAYGTLFDVNAAAQVAAQDPAHATLAAVWPALAADWRAKQLEYSWLRAIAGQHCDFWQVTQDGLDWALEAHDINDPAIRERLLELYWELPAYKEAANVLRQIKDRGVQTAILSNGSPRMLQCAVKSAGIDTLLDEVLSVEDVGIFKPADQVYDMVGARFGGAKDSVLFVSSNGWDVAGAAGFGFRTVWVNRQAAPQDRLFAKPHHVVSDLTKIPELI
ncbi:haloacid dehalogenase type II [Loktanella sp. S4079]|uniref:haloacid dehalogenase type II n=1 Tax=Loktanella sp. S4079 TaxID=579483 RepID=UPI0005F9D63A|nr:haloacid dehalogenase type II [Loktanella sp. S4079]KJZ20652.1 haloacid dehalogenase [Loktanella sp. S4079]